MSMQKTNPADGGFFCFCFAEGHSLGSQIYYRNPYHKLPFFSEGLDLRIMLSNWTI